MKLTPLTTAVLSLTAFATLSAQAADSGEPVAKEPTATAPTNTSATANTSSDTETITTYVVHYGGAG